MKFRSGGGSILAGLDFLSDGLDVNLSDKKWRCSLVGHVQGSKMNRPAVEIDLI